MSRSALHDIKDVFKIQIGTLQRLHREVNGSYEKAVGALLKCKGKVIVTGVGKSGIIAQKIAGTLASTGTPAFYFDPFDGMHGNLGAVGRGDVVIAVGKSGESEELLVLLPAIRAIGAKLVAITANKASTLAREADVVIHTPIDREACPLDLAPTSSTTAALVVGDALAAALMKRRGFHPDRFALYHPGGLLGKRLNLRVRDLMRSGRDNPVVPVEAPLRTMIREISRKRTGAVSVVGRGGTLLGLVTDYDLRKVVERGENILQKTVREVMNPRPRVISPEERAIKALEMMENTERPFSLLPVVDRKRRAVGMIHLHDLLSSGLR